MYEITAVCLLLLFFFCIIYANAELTVSSFPGPETNIALSKPANASYVKYREPGVGNDGSTSASWGSGSCMSVSGGEAKRWWQVDLEMEHSVHKVKVTNRLDCCPGRIRDFSIDVFDKDPLLDPTTPSKHCAFHAGAMSTPGYTVTLDCVEPVNGRYLRMSQMNGELQFCELQVFGKLVGVFQPCGWFERTKEKQSSAAVITGLGSPASSRVACAEECSRNVSCSGFNFRSQPEATCQVVQGPVDGTLAADTDWDFYYLNPCWRRCD